MCVQNMNNLKKIFQFFLIGIEEKNDIIKKL